MTERSNRSSRIEFYRNYKKIGHFPKFETLSSQVNLEAPSSDVFREQRFLSGPAQSGAIGFGLIGAMIDGPRGALLGMGIGLVISSRLVR